LRRFAKTEAGFGLIELLIAMTVMVIAIMAIVAAFSSGMVALNRASRASTAATLADIKMESFRKMPYASILPTCASSASAADICFPTGTPPQLGPDGKTYRVDWAVGFECPVGTLSGTPLTAICTGTEASRPVKRVTIVVVADPQTTPPTTFSETSTFDQATG
jgi:type II secretory pathway pseudopilin PulG